MSSVELNEQQSAELAARLEKLQSICAYLPRKVDERRRSCFDMSLFSGLFSSSEADGAAGGLSAGASGADSAGVAGEDQDLLFEPDNAGEELLEQENTFSIIQQIPRTEWFF